MKKTSTQLFIAVLIIISLSATIYLNTISTDLATNTEVLKVIPQETPAESILPEVQVVKTILQKFVAH